jgi:hypothetical protein
VSGHEVGAAVAHGELLETGAADGLRTWFLKRKGGQM